MDETTPVSELTLWVASAEHRLLPRTVRFKGYHLLFSGPYSFAHFGMGEGAATGCEEPAVLPVLAGARLKVGHFRYFSWVGLWVLVENLIFVVVVLLR